MPDLVMTDGRNSLTVHNPTASGVAVLEHLGWTVASGEKPQAPEPEVIGSPDLPPVVTGEAPAGNASREDWHSYATGLGIDVPEDAKRDDIKALVEAQN